jgi:magnesium transporter
MSRWKLQKQGSKTDRLQLLYHQPRNFISFVCYFVLYPKKRKGIMVFSNNPRQLPRQSLKLADQQWYINSTNNVSAYINPVNYGTITNIHERTPAVNSASIAEPRLPELLVLELHRDGGISKYRHYTIRGLYRHVLEAIADRTGVLQAAAVAHHWRRATTYPSSSVSAGAALIPPPEPVEGDASDVFLEPSTILTGNIPGESVTSPATTENATISAVQQPPSPFVKSNGAPSNAEPVTYRERLGGYLHPRDMRRLVTPFSTSNEPELIVRRHVMLLNYDPLRAIILRDRLLVLVPDGADSLLTTLEQRVRGGREAMENSVFGAKVHSNVYNDCDDDDDDYPAERGKKMTNPPARGTNPKPTTKKNVLPSQSSVSDISDKNDNKTTATDTNGDDSDANDEWHEMAAREWVNLPFELQCADAVLHVVCSILSEETFEVQMAAEAFIERIIHGGHGLEDDPHIIIRAVKDAVQLMSSRVKSFVQSLHRLLDDDEDMALMNLSRLLKYPERFIQPVPQRILNEESDEPELILEANLQIALTLTNYLDLIQGKIHTAKELIDQRLDATRNKLLFANMLISVFTLCITLGAMIGSFFGMNLEIPPSIHTYPRAFELVILYTCLGCLVLFVVIMIFLMYTGTIPFRLSRSFRPIRIQV